MNSVTCEQEAVRENSQVLWLPSCSQQIVVWGKSAAGHVRTHRQTRGDDSAQLLLNYSE